MKHSRVQGLALALLIVAAWVVDHREALIRVGYLLLIAVALLCDVAAFWLAYLTAHRGLNA